MKLYLSLSHAKLCLCFRVIVVWWGCGLIWGTLRWLFNY